MHLTKFSDYSLRVLIYLALHPERPVPLAEISEAYAVSRQHLVKVSQLLIDEGHITSVRGRHGGLRLKRPAADINVGDVVRKTEPHWNLVECFDSETNTCPIDGACGLKGVLRNAERAFIRTLEEHTIADFLPRSNSLLKLLKASQQG